MRALEVLPQPRGPGEQVGVVDPAGVERLHQRGGDMILPDDLGEGGGPVLAVQRHVRSSHAVDAY